MNKDIARLRELMAKATPGLLSINTELEQSCDTDPRYEVVYADGSCCMDNERFYPTAPQVQDAELLVEIWNTLPSLLAAVEDAERMRVLHEEYWRLEPFNMPTGGDDYEVGWRVIDFHQAKPCERTVAEVYEDDPRAALDAAIATPEQGAQ